MPENQIFSILLFNASHYETDVFCHILKKGIHKHLIHTTSDKEECARLLSEQFFDVLFVRLEDDPDLEIMKKTEVFFINKDIPVILLCSSAIQEDAIRQLKPGVFEYLQQGGLTPEILNQSIHAVYLHRLLELERKKTPDLVDKREFYLKKITESSPSVIFVFDLQTAAYVYQNRSLLTLLGYSPVEAAGISREEENRLIHADDAANIPNHLEKLKGLNDGEFLEFEYRMRHKSGHWTWLLSRDTAFITSLKTGKAIQVLVTITDITRLKNYENNLLEAKKIAESISSTKSEFLSNMSHEIRTPLNAIIGLTDILLQKNFNTVDEDNLMNIKKSADHLLVVINDILDFSKIEAGKVTLEKIPFDIRKQMEDVVSTFRHKATEQSLSLHLDIDAAVPVLVVGDPHRLNQVMMNLISNSLKFTPEGWIKVSCRMVGNTGSTARLQFAVADSGIGIPQNKHNIVFESFNQAYTDTTRKFGGTGLGLSICKKLVELQGGEISIKSEVDQGTEFMLELDYSLPQSHTQRPLNEADPLQLKDLQSKRILVVEDNMINQLVVKQLLLSWKADIEFAVNGMEALKKLEMTSYDLVLMDLQMPLMSGYEATEIIRSGKNEHIDPLVPIIALTADAFNETRKRVMDIGMNDFVAKPFSRDEFYKVLTRNLAS